ncbi:MAG: bifunctional enoyl-CoA hydratase/phosphate acetyltransferase [Defluviitaleaceae bacterium]|nr:bifunctional enoyl-CoA hydratase/phosphate acetyltransferase [Defluviitaleaceae bacterium]
MRRKNETDFRGDIINNFAEIFAMAKSKKGATVAVACAADSHVLEAVAMATKEGIANFILVGDENNITKIASLCDIDISDLEMVHEPDDATACKVAVSLVASGRANALMKGSIDTSVVMRAALDKEGGMRSGKKLSHLAAFEVAGYHKLLFVTDVAINIAPDFDTKKDIITNALAALHNLGLQKPKVALLAAKEKADEKMPVTMEYENLVKLHKNGELFGQDAIIDGPLALDNAVSAESCQIKGIDSPVGGDADLLLCPDIEAGNILYKSLAFLAGAKNGGVVIGARRPIILTSRADSAESKLISIALSVLF